MREVKFRAWDKKEKKMITWKTLCNQMRNVLASIVNEFSHWELLQRTGLKDKNDKPIYEGDIMQYYLEGNKKGGDVKYIDGAFYVTFYTSQCTRRTQILSAFLRDKKTSIVIGNIYQNPELLNTSTS